MMTREDMDPNSDGEKIVHALRGIADTLEEIKHRLHQKNLLLAAIANKYAGKDLGAIVAADHQRREREE